MNSLIPTWLSETTVPSVDMPAWYAALRKNNWDAFLQAGLPTRKNERFKYTDLSALINQSFPLAERYHDNDLSALIAQQRFAESDSILLVTVNGYFEPQWSDLAKLPKEVVICSMQEAVMHYPDLIQQYASQSPDARLYPFAAINTALWSDGLFCYVPDHCQLTTPIHLLSIVKAEDAFVAHPHHWFLLGKQSELTLIDEQIALSDHPYFINKLNTIIVNDTAKLTYYKIQQEAKRAIHMANTFVYQMKDSVVEMANFSFGAQLARDDLTIMLKEPGATCHARGFYKLETAQQYVDNHVDIDHAAPHCTSEMLYKGTLDNQSCAVFNGRLHVEPAAQKTLAYQANHNLLLSKTAEVYSKPELEIYADDVKCKHGASTGQIDQDALFYLRSRGIAEVAAWQLLVRAFADDILQMITHAGVVKRVMERLNS